MTAVVVVRDSGSTSETRITTEFEGKEGTRNEVIARKEHTCKNGQGGDSG